MRANPAAKIYTQDQIILEIIPIGQQVKKGDVYMLECDTEFRVLRHDLSLIMADHNRMICRCRYWRHVNSTTKPAQSIINEQITNYIQKR